jgi:hypothetical protein
MARPKGRGGSEQRGSGQAGDARAREELRDQVPASGNMRVKSACIAVFATIRLSRLAEQAKERECWIACGSRLAVYSASRND